METDLNNWNVGYLTPVNTWSVENFIGVGRIAIPISNFFKLLFSIFSVLHLPWTPAIMHWWHYILFSYCDYMLNISSVSYVRYQRVFFKLNYWLLHMKFVFNFDLKLYTRDTFVISTKRCEKPSDNTSTVDRDACYYSSHSIISALI